MRKLLNKIFDTDVTLILSVTALIILTAFVITDKFPLSDDPVVQRPQVVGVQMTFPGQKIGLRDLKFEVDNGSGVLVAQDHVLTNWHVVRGYLRAEKVEVILKDGSVRQAKVIKVDRVNDLALLNIPPVLYPPAEAGPPVSKGDRVTICGFPAGDNYTEIVGKVVGFAAPLPVGPDTIFKVDHLAKQGMSGGPVYNDNGEFVGILFGSLDYANCVTIDRIQQFLRE